MQIYHVPGLRIKEKSIQTVQGPELISVFPHLSLFTNCLHYSFGRNCHFPQFLNFSGISMFILLLENTDNKNETEKSTYSIPCSYKVQVTWRIVIREISTKFWYSCLVVMAMLGMKLHKPATLQEDNLKIKQKALKHAEADKSPQLVLQQKLQCFFKKLTQVYHNSFKPFLWQRCNRLVLRHSH